MKIRFTKLPTTTGTIKVSLDGGQSFTDYNIADIHESGITLSDDQNYEKIQIQAPANVLKNLNVVSSVKVDDGQASTPDEYISCDVDADMGCEWIWHGLKLNLSSSSIDGDIEDRLYVDLGNSGLTSLSDLSSSIPFEDLGITDNTYETMYVNGNYHKALSNYANNAYVLANISDLYLRFGSKDQVDGGSGLSFDHYMIEGVPDSDIKINLGSGLEVEIGESSFPLKPVEDIKEVISFDFPSNTVFQLTPTDVENEFTSELGTIINNFGDYVGTGDYKYLHLEESEDGFIINTDYYGNNNYIITNYDSFTCVYAGPYILDISSMKTRTKHDVSTSEVYSELCKKDIYLYDGNCYRRTNFKLS